MITEKFNSTFRRSISHSLVAIVAALSFQLQSANAELIYSWDFTQSATDTVNNVEATFGNPGGLGAQGYTFTNVGEGITVLQPPAVAVTGTYTIELVFSLDAIVVDEYQKIIDYENQAEDSGLYVYDDYFIFYDYDETDIDLNNVPAMQDMTFVITRHATTKFVTGKLNGQQVWSFIDTEDDAIFSAADNVMRFFEDDSSLDEHPAGTVKSIRVYNTAPAAAPATVSNAAAIAAAEKKVKKAKKALKKAKKSKVKSRIQKAKKKLKKSQAQLRILLAS